MDKLLNLMQNRQKTLYIPGLTDSVFDLKLTILAPSRADTGHEISSKDFRMNYFIHSIRILSLFVDKVVEVVVIFIWSW